MRFIIIPRPDPSAAKTGPEEPHDEKVFAAYMKFNEDMHKAGVLIAAEGLNPVAPGALVTTARGKRTVVDGPFTESKELIGGFYLLEVPSREEAIAWALRSPLGLGGDEVLEIHQMTELSDLPPRYREIIAEVAPTWSAFLTRGR